MNALPLLRRITTVSPPSSKPIVAAEEDRWFTEEVRPHEASLRAYLRLRFPRLRDLDDLIQETYFRMVRARERGKITSPKSLLFTTARNAAFDLFRRQNVVSIEGVADVDEVSTQADIVAASELLDRKQEHDLLQQAILQLPDRCRQVLTLRKIYGLSHREIAEKLDISVNTVNNQLKIGVERCRAFLVARGVKGKANS